MELLEEYDMLRGMQANLRAQRRKGLSGIAVDSDELALEWQRLEVEAEQVRHAILEQLRMMRAILSAADCFDDCLLKQILKGDDTDGTTDDHD